MCICSEVMICALLAIFPVCPVSLNVYGTRNIVVEYTVYQPMFLQSYWPNPFSEAKISETMMKLK